MLPSFQSGPLRYRTHVPVKLLNSAVESNPNRKLGRYLIVFGPIINTGIQQDPPLKQPS